MTILTCFAVAYVVCALLFCLALGKAAGRRLPGMGRESEPSHDRIAVAWSDFQPRERDDMPARLLTPMLRH